MQNTMQKFRQSSIVFEKPGICLKIWKLWWAPTIVQFNIFTETSHTFSTYQYLQKRVRDFSYFI